MMSVVPTTRRALTGMAIVVLVLAVAVIVWAAQPDETRARVVDEASADGWKRLEYRGVVVSIPDDWTRQPSDDCLVEVEHWGPRSTASCGARPGVSLLESSTFDAGQEPGVVTQGPGAGDPPWSGYVRVAELVVSVSDGDRDVVDEVLASVEAPGFQPIR